MRFNFRKFFRRFGLVFAELFAVLLMVIVILGCVLAFRLLSGPLDMAFAKPYIESALVDRENGISVKMEKVVLFWPDLREPLLLGLKDASVLDEDGNLIASIDEAALGLNGLSLMLGQVRPEGLNIKRPALSLTRFYDNSFDIGIVDIKQYGPPEPKDDSQNIVQQILAVLSADDRARMKFPMLSKLKSFEIDDAILLVNDRVLDVSWAMPRSDILVVRKGGTLNFKLDVDLPRANVAADDKAGQLSGRVKVDLKTQDSVVEFVLKDVDLATLANKLPRVPMLSKKDVVVNANIKGRYDHGANIFKLDPLSKIKLDDAVINLSADLKMADIGFAGVVRIDIDRIKQASLAPLWPVALEKENAKKWIVDRLSDGVFSDVYAKGDLKFVQGEEGWGFNFLNSEAGFKFEGMKVDYRNPLKPVTAGKGKGVFDIDREILRIDVESARLMDMNISEANVEFKNILTKGAGVAAIQLALNGPVKSALTYIQDEPLDVELRIDVANAQGRADLAVDIDFPLKKGMRVADVKVGIEGRMSDVRLPKVVRDLALSGGPFSVSVKDNALSLKGKGTVEGQAVDVDYKEFLSAKGQTFSSQAKASLMVNKNLRDQFGMDLSDFMDGAAFVDVTYTDYGDGRAEADVVADLEKARLYIKPFDYEKAVGQAGKTTLKVVLKDGDLTEIVDLKAYAPDFNMEPSRLVFRNSEEGAKLASGSVPRFTLGESIAGLDFSIAPNKVTTLSLKGPYLDARPFLNKGEDKSEGAEKQPYEAPPLRLSVDVEKMRTAPKESVQYTKLDVDIDDQGRINALDMSGIAGSGEMSVRYKSGASSNVSGPRAFMLRASDAGAALRAFGIYDDMEGGTLLIAGTPINGVFDRNLKGSAEITDFVVSDAPALTRLLGAMSLPGALNTLNGDGLRFGKMKADFSWLYKPEGSLLVLRNGRTSGNAIGLTFDGTFDNAAEQLKVKGTIIPMSGINGIIGSIPLVGDILTGGTGSLIAATYSIKGDSKNPKVSVNPLSVLTPGILRRILFEGD